MPRSYQVTPVILGRRRATEPKQVRPSSRQAKRESARRRPKAKPTGRTTPNRPQGTISLRLEAIVPSCDRWRSQSTESTCESPTESRNWSPSDRLHDRAGVAAVKVAALPFPRRWRLGDGRAVRRGDCNWVRGRDLAGQRPHGRCDPSLALLDRHDATSMAFVLATRTTSVPDGCAVPQPELLRKRAGSRPSVPTTTGTHSTHSVLASPNVPRRPCSNGQALRPVRWGRHGSHRPKR
jgi:hypothetical protein